MLISEQTYFIIWCEAICHAHELVGSNHLGYFGVKREVASSKKITYGYYIIAQGWFYEGLGIAWHATVIKPTSEWIIADQTSDTFRVSLGKLVVCFGLVISEGLSTRLLYSNYTARGAKLRMDMFPALNPVRAQLREMFEQAAWVLRARNRDACQKTEASALFHDGSLIR